MATFFWRLFALMEGWESKPRIGRNCNRRDGPNPRRIGPKLAHQQRHLDLHCIEVSRMPFGPNGTKLSHPPACVLVPFCVLALAALAAPIRAVPADPEGRWASQGVGQQSEARGAGRTEGRPPPSMGDQQGFKAVGQCVCVEGPTRLFDLATRWAQGPRDSPPLRPLLICACGRWPGPCCGWCLISAGPRWLLQKAMLIRWVAAAQEMGGHGRQEAGPPRAIAD